MYRQGLVLAGLIGGLLMSGGVALAEAPADINAQANMTLWPKADDKHDDKADHGAKIVFVCGDDNAFWNEDVHKESWTGINVDASQAISGILGSSSRDENRKCSVG
jgi:hypothetical protein